MERTVGLRYPALRNIAGIRIQSVEKETNAFSVSSTSSLRSSAGSILTDVMVCTGRWHVAARTRST